MKKNLKGLGRGLDALLGPQSASLPSTTDTASTLLLDSLVPGQYQPRTRMDEGALYELADSIRAQGIMQPILVRPLRHGEQAGRYEIIAGERRYRAARIAGLESVPVLVRDVPDEAAAAMALIENIQRENLNPLEEAQGLARLVNEFGHTHEQAAQAVGRSRSAASNLLRLLNLAEPVQTMLMAGDLDMGHARALLSLDKALQITTANQIAARKLSVREAEALVKQVSAPESAQDTTAASGQSKAAGAGSGRAPSKDVQRVEEELSDLLMAQVQIRIKKQVRRHGQMHDSGEVAIQFGSLEELNGLIERLRGG